MRWAINAPSSGSSGSVPVHLGMKAREARGSLSSGINFGPLDMSFLPIRPPSPLRLARRATFLPRLALPAIYQQSFSPILHLY